MKLLKWNGKESEISHLAARLAAAERERDEAKARAEHAEQFCYRAAGGGFVCAETVPLRATIAAQSAALAEAKEALKVGRAWSEEYLVECEDQPLEADRVRGGLATINAALATIDALKGSQI